MKVAVIGANGKVGRLVCDKLKKVDNYDPVAFVRTEEQVKYFKNEVGIDVTLTSVEDSTVGQIAEAFKKHKIEAVVFSAGAGGKSIERIFTVDLDGCCKVADACEEANISRFIVVSAIKAEDRTFWYDTALRNYYIAKNAADHYVRGTNLNYTILQPGMLETGKSTGKLCTLDLLETKKDSFFAIDRDDVAEVIVKILQHDKGTICKTIPLANGGLAIEDFLKTLYE
ncbi:uncharacterized protein KLLA0_E18283g [Kluyveromyces lactis]|uniref:KLLA0E18283p n=1 Tax=Kluyveromyces lactis (strain ATCC 8585 / CBS 2359 / DSM 70799 / NBRC 1267 / NRRL Y-1140 / WM37) TaxID=284590 RepID=Q6CMR4_KLULA|nr:uncharacterized protein KLLA0_E18283g [Kluyveromyces lactis]CAG99862.1 KLLA0E18283p [Kluyveromyces lactis]|eukprot:XP_454775.1 uncharacterized protein KLLA0_E18283g [Kluyveromyces lactis]